MSVQVWLDTLRTAGTDWADRGDDLAAAQRSLTNLDTASLGSEVSAAASDFVRAWSTRLDTLRADAERHAENLHDAARTWSAVDESSAASLRDLLPWSARDLSPGGGA